MSLSSVTKPPVLGGIRSYVRRQGRITIAQKRALKQLWTRYTITAAPAIDWTAQFGRQAPLLAEIGCGYGEAIATIAAMHPENNYIGFEVHRPGIGALLNKLNAKELSNVRIIYADAVLWLPRMVNDGALAGIYIFFPDPWPKKRHHKRRIINADFVEQLAQKITPGGFLHMATDWESYALTAESCISSHPQFEYPPAAETAAIRIARPFTRFAERGLKEGRLLSDIIFQRTPD